MGDCCRECDLVTKQIEAYTIDKPLKVFGPGCPAVTHQDAANRVVETVKWYTSSIGARWRKVVREAPRVLNIRVPTHLLRFHGSSNGTSPGRLHTLELPACVYFIERWRRSYGSGRPSCSFNVCNRDLFGTVVDRRQGTKPCGTTE